MRMCWSERDAPDEADFDLFVRLFRVSQFKIEQNKTNLTIVPFDAELLALLLDATFRAPQPQQAAQISRDANDRKYIDKT